MRPTGLRGAHLCSGGTHPERRRERRIVRARPEGHFLESYFHQDALVDDPDWQSIVARFLAENPEPHGAAA